MNSATWSLPFFSAIDSTPAPAQQPLAVAAAGPRKDVAPVLPRLIPDMLQFQALPLWLNVALFGAAAGAIWMAGTRLSRYADEIADRTGVGKAFIGALLLGGITSLPEAATTVTAAATGSAPLAVNNILGGVAMQITVLAVADAVVPSSALAARVGKPSVLLQGALLIIVLALAAMGIALGDVSLLGVGLWPSGILGTSILAFFLIHEHRSRETWEPESKSRYGRQSEKGGTHTRDTSGDRSMSRLMLLTAAAGLAILIAGFVVARTGDALAEQTGLGQSFVGVLFLAIATSLPEVSTTLSAVRMGEFAMAFSNIFGANILDISVLFLADVAFREGPILGEVGRFSLVGALLGIVVTAVFLVGLLERRRRKVAGVGLNSLLVLLLYAGGIFVLYTLR